MAKDFYERLGGYYTKVAEVLRGEVDVGAVFPNSSDVGSTREHVYIKFLRQHCPQKCNVFAGGFLFAEDGSESKQLDVIVTTDTAPRYDFHNPDGSGKSFACVEGCIAVASIKSFLTKDQLFDALGNLASIPPTQPIGKRGNPQLKIENYEKWPTKIVYASDGLKAETILSHLYDFYAGRPDIPKERKADFIHVAGKYFIPRLEDGTEVANADGTIVNTKGVEYYVLTSNSDVQAICCTLEAIQRGASAATHILFSHFGVTNNLLSRFNDKTD